MISYNVYNVVHMIGVVALFLALGGLTAHAMAGGTRDTNPSRRWMVAWHGLGLLIILIGGFGMLARLGVMGMLPGWVWAKLVIWVVLGAALMLVGRRPALGRPVWLLALVLGGLAAWLGIYQPF